MLLYLARNTTQHPFANFPVSIPSSSYGHQAVKQSPNSHSHNDFLLLGKQLHRKPLKSHRPPDQPSPKLHQQPPSNLRQQRQFNQHAELDDQPTQILHPYDRGPRQTQENTSPRDYRQLAECVDPCLRHDENPESWPNSCPAITRAFTFQGRVTYSVDDRIKRAVLENSQKFGLRGHILMALYTLVFFSRREQDLFWKCVANFTWEMLPEEKHFVRLTGCTAQIEAGLTQATGAPVKGAFVNGNAYFDVTCARGIQWYPYYEGRRIHDEIIQFGAQQRPSALF
jgi:hypothetical protein